jgi:site-specific recombinase XerD
VTSYRRIPHLWRHPNGYLYIVHSDRGLWRRKATKTTTLAAAQDALRAFVEKGAAATAAPNRLTLGEAAARWIPARTAEGTVAAKTLRAYALTVSRLQAAPVSRIQVGEIEAKDLREIVQGLRASGVPAVALAREVTHIRMLFRWLVKEGIIRLSPAEAVAIPKAPRGRRPAILQEQFDALRAAVQADLDAAAVETARREVQMLADLLEVLWRSGLRSIEAIRLTWDDVDLEARTWRQPGAAAAPRSGAGAAPASPRDRG